MAENRSQDKSLLDKMSAEVTPETSPLLQVLTNNAKLIAVVMALCFLAAVGYSVYSWLDGKKVAKAQENLAQILVVKDNADRLAKLKTFAASAPEAVKKNVALAIAKTAMQIQNYAEAFSVWDSLAKDPKDPIYPVALVGKAETLSRQDKVAEALALLEGAALPADSEVITLVNSLIADLAERSGDTDKAIAMCEKIATGMAARSPEEAEFWRQKTASLRANKTGK